MANGYGGYSPYTGAGNLASAMGANPNFGGSTGGYQAGGYQYPNNVGGVNYSGAAPSGYAWGANGLVPIGTGAAGIQAYNPAISTSPTRSFQAPSFTNSMSNWLGAGGPIGGGPGGGSYGGGAYRTVGSNAANLPSGYAGNTSAMTPSSSGDFQIPGSSGRVAASPYDPYASLYAAMGLNSGQRGGTSGGGMGYPAAQVGNMSWATGSPTAGQANQALSDVLANQPRTLAWNGQPNWGIVNNNPGNIQARDPSRNYALNPWTAAQPGFVDPGYGNRFAQFSDMNSGVNALQANLQAYGGAGKNTLASIVPGWAPTGENNTAAYMALMGQGMGVGPQQKLNMSDPWTLNNLAAGISNQETGAPLSSIRSAIASMPQNQVFANASNQALQNAGVYGTTLNSSGGRYH